MTVEFQRNTYTVPTFLTLRIGQKVRVVDKEWVVYGSALDARNKRYYMLHDTYGTKTQLTRSELVRGQRYGTVKVVAHDNV